MRIYQDVYIDQKKEEAKLIDIAAHQQGMYVMQAIGAAFSKKAKYPEEPYSVQHDKQEQLQNMTQEQYVSAFESAINRMNKQFEK